MAELESALLFGVTIHFKIKMGANTPGSVWFGFIWFGWYALDLFDGEGNFSVGEYYCHNPNSTPTSTLGWDDFRKISQIFMGIGQTSSVMLR